MCGEYSAKNLGAVARIGSPPRVWGILLPIPVLDIRLRITPTCVGNTPSRFARWPVVEDHPHVCGEYTACASATTRAIGSPPRVWGIQGKYGLAKPAAGSPPRVWGIQILRGNVFAIIRITPTCVGNTKMADENAVEFMDHPHVCGEYPDYLFRPHDSRGSPPRVWGILLSRVRKRTMIRITPTCVGNTSGLG